MDLNTYMEDGIAGILKIAGRYYLKDAAGIAFLAKAAPAMRRAAKKRTASEAAGPHIPPFLIASIASECNLHCTGCYAWANGTIGAAAKAAELSDGTWARIFDEADELGISFILLAGGEPTLRRGVIEAAAAHRGMVFPLFTNGSFIDAEWISFFDANRNIIPVFSLEGDFNQTDARRGAGVAARVHANMEQLRRRHILWGVSYTVTRENLDAVTDEAALADLQSRGCGLAIFNEYVPIACGTEHMALTTEDARRMMARIDGARDAGKLDDLITLCFPGDEELLGGCLAAGRGFFHINYAGAAEPCPFSPFSVANVAEVGIKGALESDFFARVRAVEAAHTDDHLGGCTLFRYKDEVLSAIG